MNKQKLGFIGLGIMGFPMAKNLIKAGYSLVVYDIATDRLNEMRAMGAEVGNSCTDVAEKTRIIITMLPNSPHVCEVVLGECGTLKGMKSGDILVDMSSIAPLESQKISAVLAEKGIETIDAPVSGGQSKAEDGSLAIMAGGKEDIFNRVKKILLCMGASAHLVGSIGSGNTTKLANQIIVGLNIAAMSEAMVLAVKAGVDPLNVFEAIRGGLDGHCSLFRGSGTTYCSGS